MINKEDKLEMHLKPEVIDALEILGVKGLENEAFIRVIKKKTFGEIGRLSNYDGNDFIGDLNNMISSYVSKVEDEEKISISGLLPCPIRNNIIEVLEKSKIYKNLELNLEAASFGLDFIKSAPVGGDVYISAGFDYFLTGEFDSNEYEVLDDEEIPINDDFKKLDIVDSKKKFLMIGGVPGVILVNVKKLGNRKMPESILDILDDEYAKDIGLPLDDFDLFNAILITIYKNYGKAGVEKLRNNFSGNFHPSQMVKKGNIDILPTLMIIPYFFSRILGDRDDLKLVWPSDGAIVSPIFITSKKEVDFKRRDLIEEATKILASKEIGEIMAYQGKFPSVRRDVYTPFEGKYNFVGFKYINSLLPVDMIIAREIFFGGK